MSLSSKCRRDTIANDPHDSNPIPSCVLTCQNVTMAQFTSRLHSPAPDHFLVPVEDETGLRGAYDFSLSFTPSWIFERLQTSNNNGSGASDPNGAISIFDAVSKQLGLMFEKSKRLAPVLVVDHIDRKPLEN